jgi:dienelactone hydrolase
MSARVLVSTAAAALALLAGCSDSAGSAAKTPASPSAAGPGESSSPSASSTSPQRFGARLSYVDPAGESVKPTTHAYNDELELDLYRPAAATAVPVVVFVHGVSDNTEMKSFGPFSDLARNLTVAGVASVVPNFRPDDSSALRQGTRDLADVLAFVNSEGPALGLDAGRFAVAGFSAGGPYAIHLACHAKGGPARALALFYAHLDGYPWADPKTPADYRIRTCVNAAPETALVAAVGREEGIPGIRESVEQAPSQVEVLWHPTGGHGFDFLSQDDESAEIVRRVTDVLVAALDKG